MSESAARLAHDEKGGHDSDPARLWRQSLRCIVSATRSGRFCGGEIVTMKTIEPEMIGARRLGSRLRKNELVRSICLV